MPAAQACAGGNAGLKRIWNVRHSAENYAELHTDHYGIYLHSAAHLQDAGRNVAWTQDEGSLCIGVQVSDGVKGKDVNLEVHPTRMKLEVQDQHVLEGSFPAAVVPDGCFFAMETADNARMCVITLEKRDASGERWVELFEEEALDASITDQASSVTT